jgi:hypothetical protein
VKAMLPVSESESIVSIHPSERLPSIERLLVIILAVASLVVCILRMRLDAITRHIKQCGEQIGFLDAHFVYHDRHAKLGRLFRFRRRMMPTILGHVGNLYRALILILTVLVFLLS